MFWDDANTPVFCNQLIVRSIFFKVSCTLEFNHISFLFPDGFQTCQDISRFTQKSGVYGIILAGDPKHVFCSVEVNHTWTVRYLLFLGENHSFYEVFLPCNFQHCFLLINLRRLNKECLLSWNIHETFKKGMSI